jgi:poly-gamma-glutamate synthesis protein (capsule biosynthesis protein)
MQGGLPEGTALVTSLRLPLFGIGGSDVEAILSGRVPSWLDVGAAVDLPVEPIALQGSELASMAPVASVPDYEALVQELRTRPGGVAVVPLDQIDWRVNVLAIDGVDPLRDGEHAEPVIRVGVVGDIVPGRNVDLKMRAYGDFTRPFRKIAAELSSYDIAFANLEGNLSANIPPPDDPHTFSFISSPEMLDGFKLAGIDAVSLANNHSTWNSAGWGVSALLDTLDALDAAGVGRFGAGRNLDEARAPWTAEVKGRRIAVIGIDGVTANEAQREPDATVYNTWLGAPGYAGAGPDQPGTNPYMVDQFTADISRLASEHDIVIPYFHLGREYVALPPAWAVDGARAAIDAGATMVVTNHPHLVQCLAEHAGRPIVFSPGNFIFDQMFSAEVRQGFILEIDFRGSAVVGLRMRGIEIVDFHQPRLMSDSEHAALMDRFWRQTDALAQREGRA